MEKKILRIQCAETFDILLQNNKKEIKFKLVQKNQHMCLL